MFIHYLKIAWRNILKDKGYSIINIMGLSIAISCCFLLIFWVKFELSYENCYPGSERIYKMLEEEQRADGLTYKVNIRPSITEKLKATFPQIEYATFTSMEDLSFTIEGKEGDGIMAAHVSSNEDFLRIFAYEYVEGTPQSVVDSRGSIMSEETAYKFFGKESAIGRTVTFAGRDNYTIAAVVKVPGNTHINFEILTPTGNMSSYGGIHYLKLKDGYKMTPEFEEQIARFLSTMRETKNTWRLQPIRQMHLHSPKEVTDRTYGSLAQIYFFSGAALLILLVAIINYVNTSIARSINRMKEVGVRKVFGSNRRQLIKRFLIESFILSFIAIFISLVFVELLFPSFSDIMGKRVPLDFSFMTILIALFTCIAISVLSGGYAAFYLSSFSPMLIMRGKSKTGTKEGLRKALIGVQFFLSISVLICTLFIYKQINAIFNADTYPYNTCDSVCNRYTGLFYGAKKSDRIT
jgi:ABC-type transport system, involved in lipoprotein release, permease component